jgi:predicted metal-dependent hydrolase
MSDGGATHPSFAEGAGHFNAGRYYEAHESWEDLWRTLSGRDRLFLQALIQASVALHHLERGNLAGARQLARSTFSKLAVLPPSMWGVDCDALADELAARLDPLLGPAPPRPEDLPRGLPPIVLRVDSALPGPT